MHGQNKKLLFLPIMEHCAPFFLKKLNKIKCQKSFTLFPPFTWCARLFFIHIKHNQNCTAFCGKESTHKITFSFVVQHLARLTFLPFDISYFWHLSLLMFPTFFVHFYVLLMLALPTGVSLAGPSSWLDPTTFFARGYLKHIVYQMSSTKFGKPVIQLNWL